jgi:hypothetical protein
MLSFMWRAGLGAVAFANVCGMPRMTLSADVIAVDVRSAIFNRSPRTQAVRQ